MKRIFSLSLAAIMMVSVLAGCAPKAAPGADSMTPEARTTLYKTAIETARDAETNEYMTIITSSEDGMASMLMELMGLTKDDMTAFAISASAMNVQAYGVAAVMPAKDKAETVKAALQAFVDQQKSNFEQYLVGQYEVAKAAKLETLSDGTILLVMCEGQDEIFTSIKTAIEAGK